jgi:hypothetical protein
MNSRKGLSLLAALPIAWLVLAAPVSARDEQGSLHDARYDEHGDGHDQRNARHANGDYLLYAEQGGDRDIGRELAAYQRTRNAEETQGYLDRERQDSLERNDDTSRYYWWWPFWR